MAARSRWLRRQDIVQILAKKMATRVLGDRKPVRPGRMDDSVPVLERIELPGPVRPRASRVGLRPDADDQWTGPRGKGSERLVPARPLGGELLDRLLSIRRQQEASTQLGNVLEHQRQSLSLRRVVRPGRVTNQDDAFASNTAGENIRAGNERGRSDGARAIESSRR